LVEKRQLNIRLPVDLYDKLNMGEGSMVGIIEAALRQYFDTFNVSSDIKDVSHLITEVEYLRSENTKLLELLSREQIKGMDLQKKLMPSPEEITKKNWWQFWK
jgi:regulator of replication initiation timing